MYIYIDATCCFFFLLSCVWVLHCNSTALLYSCRHIPNKLGTSVANLQFWHVYWISKVPRQCAKKKITRQLAVKKKRQPIFFLYVKHVRSKQKKKDAVGIRKFFFDTNLYSWLYVERTIYCDMKRNSMSSGSTCQI